jgi:hypothetical protein
VGLANSSTGLDTKPFKMTINTYKHSPCHTGGALDSGFIKEEILSPFSNTKWSHLPCVFLEHSKGISCAIKSILSYVHLHFFFFKQEQCFVFQQKKTNFTLVFLPSLGESVLSSSY